MKFVFKQKAKHAKHCPKACKAWAKHAKAWAKHAKAGRKAARLRWPFSRSDKYNP